mmetsp:Transcript_7501/g.13094  ORF Transcript_7501/g.13094 Transcript_7501/m.13094 type:complete len:94 (+) Transcript_7501:35-316(+)
MLPFAQRFHELDDKVWVVVTSHHHLVGTTPVYIFSLLYKYILYHMQCVLLLFSNHPTTPSAFVSVVAAAPLGVHPCLIGPVWRAKHLAKQLVR